MQNTQRTATIVGVLFIVGTIIGVPSVIVTAPILGSPDYLAGVAANPSPMILGALCMLAMGLGHQHQPGRPRATRSL